MIETRLEEKWRKPGWRVRALLAYEALKGFITLPPSFGEAFGQGEVNPDGTPTIGGRSIKNPAAVHPYSRGIIGAITETASRVPFKLFQGEREITSGPAVDLFARPNQIDSWTDLLEATLAGLLQFDRGVLWILSHRAPIGVSGPEPTPRDFPVAIRMVNANLYEPKISRATGKIVWNPVNKRHRPLTDLETVWFRYPDPDDRWKSLAPFRALKRSIEGDIEAADYSNELLRNGAKVGLVLSTKGEGLAEEQAKRLGKKINLEHSQKGKRFRALVLGGADWQVADHAQSQKDLDYVEGRRFGREEQRAATRTGPAQLGDVEDANRSNMTGQERLFWTQVLVPLLVNRIQGTINAHMLPTFTESARVSGSFDFDEVEALQGDLEREAKIGIDLEKLGWTPNEIADFFDWSLPKSPERAAALVPGTMVTREDLLAGGIPEEDDDDEDVGDAPASGGRDSEESRGASPHASLTKDALADAWASAMKDVTPIERAMRKKVGRVFFQLRSKVLRSLRDLDRDLSASDLGEVVFSQDEATAAFVDQLGKVIGQAFRAGDRSIESKIVTTVGDDVVAYMLLREPQIVGIASTTRIAVEQSLLRGIIAAESAAALELRVQAVFAASARRSQTIARTEVLSAYNNGRMAQAERQGLDRIQWVSAADPDVRETHASVHGTTVKRGETFANGLRFPHDPAGPAREVINCRCTPLPVNISA